MRKISQWYEIHLRNGKKDNFEYTQSIRKANKLLKENPGSTMKIVNK